MRQQLGTYDQGGEMKLSIMAMAFQMTGNLHVIKDWILSLRVPYDRNNEGETEADILGQALYLISLVSDKSHPLVPIVRQEFARFENDEWIEGRSDLPTTRFIRPSGLSSG
jgi:hypothetical protein